MAWHRWFCVFHFSDQVGHTMSNEPELRMRTLDMKDSLKLLLAVAMMTIAIVVSSEPSFARGAGAGNILNSPGYQRRLQESRRQLSQPHVQPSSTYRRKW
jgi:hypothetical protein